MAYGACLESMFTERYRGFESLILRIDEKSLLIGDFLLYFLYLFRLIIIKYLFLLKWVFWSKMTSLKALIN